MQITVLTWIDGHICKSMDGYIKCCTQSDITFRVCFLKQFQKLSVVLPTHKLCQHRSHCEWKLFALYSMFTQVYLFVRHKNNPQELFLLDIEKPQPYVLFVCQPQQVTTEMFTCKCASKQETWFLRCIIVLW